MEFSDIYLKLAVITYMLSKILSKPRLISRERYDDLKQIELTLKDIIKSLAKQNEKQLLLNFKKTENAILSLEKRDKRYMRDMLSKGKLKVAATLYAQGFSLGRASEMTHVEKQDILEYAGRTMMFDRVKNEKGIMQRIRSARRLIGA